MIKIQFKCKLLSDLIINQKSASEGPNQTLDFIPGNCFLGIAAASLYKDTDLESLDLFHSGSVRFSDAHPAYCDIRPLKTPLSLYSPKYSSNKEKRELYQIFLTDTSEVSIISKQLKQERKGFICFENQDETINAIGINLSKSFALKSAYDRETRRSEDEKLFGYESLSPTDSIFYLFDIEFDNANSENDEIVRKVSDSICGKKRIGRSKSAEYGSVYIERSKYNEISSTNRLTTFQEDSKVIHLATVFADGRLIFLDDEGLPKIGNITAQDLGFDVNAIIRWDKSQIRLFKYAPWNNKRKCFDSDRYGYEKGCVFVVQTEKTPSTTRYIGNFKNEGFGRVIYNPEFLMANPDGSAVFSIKEMNNNTVKDQVKFSDTKTVLLDYLEYQRKTEKTDLMILEEVQKWIIDNRRLFRRISSSQWGSIRAKASQNHNYQNLVSALDNYIERDALGARIWKNGPAKAAFQRFYKDKADNEMTNETKNMMYRKVITLSTLMQKENQKDNLLMK